MVAGGATATEVARQLGVSERQARRRLAAAGLAPAPARRGRPATRAPVRTYQAELGGLRVTVRAEGAELIRQLGAAAGGSDVGRWCAEVLAIAVRAATA